MALLAEDRNFNEARQYLEKAIPYKDSNYQIDVSYYREGVRIFENGQLSLASEKFEQIESIDKFDDLEIYKNIIKTIESLKDLTKLVKQYDVRNFTSLIECYEENAQKIPVCVELPLEVKKIWENVQWYGSYVGTYTEEKSSNAELDKNGLQFHYSIWFRKGSLTYSEYYLSEFKDGKKTSERNEEGYRCSLTEEKTIQVEGNGHSLTYERIDN